MMLMDISESSDLAYRFSAVNSRDNDLRILYALESHMADDNESLSEGEEHGEAETEEVPPATLNGFPPPPPSADGAKKPKKPKKPRASVLEYKTVNEMYSAPLEKKPALTADFVCTAAGTGKIMGERLSSLSQTKMTKLISMKSSSLSNEEDLVYWLLS